MIAAHARQMNHVITDDEAQVFYEVPAYAFVAYCAEEFGVESDTIVYAMREMGYEYAPRTSMERLSLYRRLLENVRYLRASEGSY